MIRILIIFFLLSLTQNVSADFNSGDYFGKGGGAGKYVSVPSSSTDMCTAGQYSFDSNYFYACTGVNTWQRVALSTWGEAGPSLLLQTGSFILLQNGGKLTL